MEIVDLGHLPYREAHEHQLAALEVVQRHPEREQILLCSHPPVVTLGRKSKQNDLCGWQGEVIAVERGGQATYHGPGQIVAYPILNLQSRGCDIYRYLRQLEKAVVQTLASYGVIAQGDPANTGVWVGKQKIASIGIAIKRWATYHGIAINIDYDPLAFQGIRPCGFAAAKIMTSLEELLGAKVDKLAFRKIFAKNLSDSLHILTFQSSISTY